MFCGYCGYTILLIHKLLFNSLVFAARDSAGLVLAVLSIPTIHIIRCEAFYQFPPILFSNLYRNTYFVQVFIPIVIIIRSYPGLWLKTCMMFYFHHQHDQ